MTAIKAMKLGKATGVSEVAAEHSGEWYGRD
jgi:hypothetical protein